MNFRSIVLRTAAWIALAASLASCGGSSNGLVAFVPGRILVFGDESSVITAEGRKYTVNALNDDGTAIDCTLNPIWIQVLASSYSLVFPECVGTSTDTAPASRILAKAGATAGGAAEIDLAQQVNRQLELPVADGGGISSSDMVTMLVGTNDVVAAFERYKLGLATSDEAIAQAEAAGEAIAMQTNRIAEAGGKVIISTVPDVSRTPYGVSQDADGTVMLSLLTARVNARLLVTINNNGRMIGLIELNPYLINVVANPTYYGYVNARDAACVPLDPLLCTTSTLYTNADGTSAGPFTWLWASALQLSPGGHGQLGNLAQSRAHNQPF